MDFIRRRSSLSIEKHPRSGGASGAEAEAVPAPAAGFVPGQDVGGFQVVREIGRSGLSVVLEARDPSLDRSVALKVLAPELSDVPDAAARFRQEAALAARASHPSLIPVLSRGTRGGFQFYAEPLLECPTLEDLLATAPEAREESFFLRLALGLSDVARGVDLLHRSGILHRAIKPSNIFVEGGRLILGDFKLSLDVKEAPSPAPAKPEEQFRAEGLGRETVYMAPEEFLAGGAPGPAADIYSLGMVLYEAATGMLPFPVCRPAEMARLKLTRRPIAPRRLNPAVPLGLEAVIRQAIEESASLRHPTAADLARDLERFAMAKRGATRRHLLRSDEIDRPAGADDDEGLRDLARIA